MNNQNIVKNKLTKKVSLTQVFVVFICVAFFSVFTVTCDTTYVHFSTNCSLHKIIKPLITKESFKQAKSTLKVFHLLFLLF